MVRSFFNSVLLLLLAFPILYILWMRLLPCSQPDGSIVYFAIKFSGTLLLIYAFIIRSLLHEKVLSSIAFLIGGLWLGFEIIFIVRTFLINNI